MLLTVLVFITAIFILSLGGFVLARNSKASINIHFAYFSFTVSLWVIANYLGANFKTYSFSPLFIRLDFLLGPWMAYLFWKLTSQISKPLGIRLSHKVFTYIFLLPTLIISILAFTPLLIVFTKGAAGATQISYGMLYPVYALCLIILPSFGLLNLVIANHRAAHGVTKAQIGTMLWGMTIAFVFAGVPNLVVPQLTKSERINLPLGNLAYLGLAFFCGTTTYAIVKHRLFDIRLVVARSVAYILSLGVLVGGYSLLLVLSSTFLGQIGPTAQQATNFMIIIFLGLTYQPLKRSFDKATNRVFYRDAYDTQEFLDELNKVLVSTIELKPLLTHTSRIIRDTLKSEFCVFGIKETESHARRIVGTIETHFEEDDMMVVRNFTPKAKKKIIVTDDIVDEHADIRELLRSANIAIIARLTNTPSGGDEGYGYLLLGAKRSGNPYSRQDLKNIEIITDELVIAVQNALRFEEIENFNIRLQEEVNSATKELRVTNQRLRELDQTKDDFISMASHQLRTPLTSVKGYVSMVLEGDVGKISPMQHKLLEQAFISSQRMVYLIADLLNISRLRTGKFLIEPGPTDLSEVIAGEAAQLRDIAHSRGLQLTYNRPNHFPTLMLDEAKIRQVIMNFTDNAIYYTPSGGQITLDLRDNPDSVEFTVTDTGIGVPKNEQHRLFTKFYRAANAKKARPDGTGLGLFMAKKVVAAQGGAIIFSSTEGKGSTFGFTFPKAKLLTNQPARQHGKPHRAK